MATALEPTPRQDVYLQVRLVREAQEKLSLVRPAPWSCEDHHRVGGLGAHGGDERRRTGGKKATVRADAVVELGNAAWHGSNGAGGWHWRKAVAQYVAFEQKDGAFATQVCIIA